MNISKNIYVLELENRCYYIGTTDNLEKTIKLHNEGRYTPWTILHKPKKLLEIKAFSIKEEYKILIEYMAKYTIDKVRSDSYSNIELTKEQIKILQKDIRILLKLCLRCGDKNHSLKDCIVEKDIDGNIIEEKEDNIINIYVCNNCNKEYLSEERCLKHEKYCYKKRKICYRCGKKNHYAKECFSRTNKDGDELSSDFYDSHDSE